MSGAVYYDDDEEQFDSSASFADKMYGQQTMHNDARYANGATTVATKARANGAAAAPAAAPAKSAAALSPAHMTASAAAAAAMPATSESQTAIEAALNANKNIHVIGTPLTFQWTGPKKAPSGTGYVPQKEDGSVVAHTPLMTALTGRGLSPEEKLNVREMYIEKAANISKSAIAIKVSALNGRDLKKNHHADGSWSTLVLHPGEQVDYSHMNHGRGLRIASNNLDQHGDINVAMSPAEMMQYAKVPDGDEYKDANGKPLKFVTRLDLSGYGQHTDPVEQLKPLEKNPLGLLVYANAKVKINSHPGIEQAIGGRLPAIEPKDLELVDMLPDLQLAPAQFGKPGQFDAMIDAQHLRDLVDIYATNNAAKAQPTSAKEHKIEVFRLGGAGPKDHIGDLSKELGVTSADIDRAAHTLSGVHLQVNYVVQHNGKKYDNTKK